MTQTSRSREPMTYEQAMHELRKVHKGMRRLQRRLVIAEGLLGKIYRIVRWNTGTIEQWNERYKQINSLSRYAFYDAWKAERCSEKLDKHLMYKQSEYASRRCKY